VASSCAYFVGAKRSLVLVVAYVLAVVRGVSPGGLYLVCNAPTLQRALQKLSVVVVVVVQCVQQLAQCDIKFCVKGKHGTIKGSCASGVLKL
jgi:hypothetical protein